MFAEATRPALMARMTVAGPVWQSPPLKRPSKLGTAPSESVTTQPPLAGDAHVLKRLGIDVLPMATNTRSQGMTRRAWRRHAGPDARGEARR